MSWRDELQPASFRGVEFHVESSRGTFGRRNAVHEYPGQDKPYVEDLGRRAREFNIEAFVIGDNYTSRRDALIAAIEQGGTGTLIHPRLGALKVSITDQCSWTETTREGGMATFSLAFVESGDRQFPSNQTDSVADVETAVNNGLTAVQTDFKKRFSIAGLPGWVAENGQALLEQGFDLLAPLTQTANAPTALARTLEGLRNNLSVLMGSPEALAEQTINAMRDIYATLTGIDSPRTVHRQLTDSYAAVTPINPTTPARTQEASNQSAISNLFVNSAAFLTTQTVAQQSPGIAVSSDESPFDSYEHAVVVRDELVSDLTVVAETGDDQLYVTSRSTQVALVRHINAHGFNLERIRKFTPAEILPALVIAFDLYGDANREADVIKRNKIRHPGFVPSGNALEVLNA